MNSNYCMIYISHSKAYKLFAKDIEDERLTTQQLQFCLHHAHQ
jgi:hypothetical protein